MVPSSDPLSDTVKLAIDGLLETATALMNCEMGSDKLVSNATSVYYVAAKQKSARNVLIDLGELLENYVGKLKDAIIEQMKNVFDHLPRRSPSTMLADLLETNSKPEIDDPFLGELVVRQQQQQQQQQQQPQPQTPPKSFSESQQQFKQSTKSRKLPSLSVIISSYVFLQMKSLSIRIAAQRTSLWFLDEAFENGKLRNTLKCIAMYPYSSSYSSELSPLHGICGPVMQSRVALNFKSAKQSTLFTPETCRALGVDTEALLCFPVLRGISRQCIGLLFASNKSHSQTERFTELDEISCCETVELISRVFGSYGSLKNISPVNVPVKVLMMTDSDKNDKQHSEFDQTTSTITDQQLSLPDVPPQLVTDVFGVRQLQHVYRTGARPSHISGKETITAKAVVMDGSNLADLSQQLSWMEQMWRGSLDENTVLYTECRWWQGRTAESQAKLRWIQRQIDRAQRAEGFSQAKVLLSQLPPEADSQTTKPDTGRVRDYTSESISDIDSMQRHWVASLGIPSEDKCTQTDVPESKTNSFRYRGRQSFAISRASCSSQKSFMPGKRFSNFLPIPPVRKNSRHNIRVPMIGGIRKQTPMRNVELKFTSEPQTDSSGMSTSPLCLEELQSPFESNISSLLPGGVNHEFPPSSCVNKIAVVASDTQVSTHSPVLNVFSGSTQYRVPVLSSPTISMRSSLSTEWEGSPTTTPHQLKQRNVSFSNARNLKPASSENLSTGNVELAPTSPVKQQVVTFT